jgi:hypothetical protein
VTRSRYDNRPNPETSRAPSYVSGLTEYSRVDDDDERSLIPHQESPAPKSRSDKALQGCEVSSQSLRKKRYRFKSWKIGVTTAAAMTTTVLLVNLLTVWASVKFGLEGDIGTAYGGACGTVSAWSFWLHILINGLSSILLSASNYTMQCVTAPTRRECDHAHARGDWLDVGIPSVRNLSRISWQRKIMWALLALSSTPIHLLYNSAVFKTLDNNEYDLLLIGRSFLEKDYHVPSIEAIMNTSSVSNKPAEVEFKYISKMHEVYLSSSSFTKLSTDVCISTYATYYLSGHSNVLLVADDTNNEMIPRVTPNLRRGLLPFGW